MTERASEGGPVVMTKFVTGGGVSFEIIRRFDNDSADKTGCPTDNVSGDISRIDDVPIEDTYSVLIASSSELIMLDVDRLR